MLFCRDCEIATVKYDTDLHVEAYHFQGIMQKFPNHFHEYYVIGFIEGGKRHLICKNKEFNIEPGDLLLFNPHDNHTCEQMDEKALDYRRINVQPDIMRKAVFEITGKNNLPYFTPQVVFYSDFVPLLRELHLMIMQEEKDFRKEEISFFLLEQLIEKYTEQGVPPSDTEQSAGIEYGEISLSSGSLPKNGECVLPKAMKSAYRLQQGDMITIRTESGSTALKISGFAANNGICEANFGKCVLIDYHNVPGYGLVTYKLMLKQGADSKAVKTAVQNALIGKDTVDYPSGQSEQILKEVDLLFGTMMGFGFLTLLLGTFLINVTVNEYIRKMRGEISAMKVLGAVKSDIVKLVLSKSFAIGLAGASLGAAVGIGGSFGLIRLVDRSFSGGMNIQPVIKWSIILAIAIGALLFCLLVTVPAALRAANETIMDGFYQFAGISSVSITRIVIAGIFAAVMTAARIFTGQWIFTFAAIIAGIYFIALIAFIPCAQLILRLINRVSPFNGFTVKNNLIKQPRRAINLADLFSFVIAMSVGMILVVNEIADLTDRLEKGEYFGNAVVSTVTGQGISSDILSKIQITEGVAKAYPLYEKELHVGDDDVQVKGFCLDDTNEDRLTRYWGIDMASLQKLEAPDTILVSEKILDDEKMKVGDALAVGSGTDVRSFKIIGSYSTMSNDGKSCIVSDTNFLHTFQNYSIRAVNVFSKSGTGFDTLKTNLTNSVHDKFIQVDSTAEVQEAAKKQYDQFLMLINCMIVVLVATSTLMLVNSISMNQKNSQVALSITKLLGATGRNLVTQSSIEGIIYEVFGTAVGLSAGSALNLVLTASMNHRTAWHLIATFPPDILGVCGVGFIAVVLLAEMISTAFNYRSDYKSILVQE